jgi:hypothetical protein
MIQVQPLSNAILVRTSTRLFSGICSTRTLYIFYLGENNRTSTRTSYLVLPVVAVGLQVVLVSLSKVLKKVDMGFPSKTAVIATRTDCTCTCIPYYR